MNRIVLLFFVLLVFALSSCVVGRPVDYQTQTGQGHKELVPTLNISMSRALYLAAQARLHSMDGDSEGALALLNEALAEDPNASYLHAAEASLFMKLNRPDEALKAAELAVKNDPDNRNAQLMTSGILSMMKRDRDAIPHLKKAIDLAPAKEDAYLNLAVTYVRIFEYEEAVNTLKQLITVSPASSAAYYYLGKTYSQMKLYREALNYFKKAREFNPDFDQALLEMAMTAESSGMNDEAINYYQDYLKENPTNLAVIQHLTQLYIIGNRLEDALGLLKTHEHSGAVGLEVRRKRGLIDLELERYDDAIEEFAAILQQEPDSPQVRFYLATTYEEKGDIDKALQEFGRIPRTAFNYIEALGHRAFLYRDQGNPDKGIVLLKESITLEPQRVELYLYLSGLYESLDRFGDALAILEGVEKDFSTNTSFLFRIGVIQDKVGKRQESIATMKRVIALAPDDPQALNFLGYTYAELGTNLDEALEYLKKAVSLRPDDGFILDSLGWVYFKKKQYDEAIENLEKASRLADDDATILMHLGDAYAETAQYRRALQVYKKALELEPDRKEVADRIKKIKAETGEK